MSKKTPEWHPSNIEPLLRALAFSKQNSSEISPAVLATMASSEKLITQLLLIDRLLYALAIEPRMVTLLALPNHKETTYGEIMARISAIIDGNVEDRMPRMKQQLGRYLRKTFEPLDLVEVTGDESEYGYSLNPRVGHYAQALAKLFLGQAIALQKPLSPLFGEKIGSKFENRPYISRFSTVLFLWAQHKAGVAEVSAQTIVDALQIDEVTISWAIDGLQKIGVVAAETIDTAQGSRWQEYTLSGDIDEALGKLASFNQISRLILDKFRQKQTLTRSELCEGIPFSELGINRALRTLRQIGLKIDTKWMSNEQHTRVKLTPAGVDLAERVHTYMTMIVNEEDPHIAQALMSEIKLDPGDLTNILVLYQAQTERHDPEHSKRAMVEYIETHADQEVSAVEIAQKFKNYRPLLDQLVVEKRLEKITKSDSRVFYKIGSNQGTG